jgi:hypothetical protein
MATPSLEQVTKVLANGVEAVSSPDLTVEEGETSWQAAKAMMDTERHQR